MYKCICVQYAYTCIYAYTYTLKHTYYLVLLLLLSLVGCWIDNAFVIPGWNSLALLAGSLIYSCTIYRQLCIRVHACEFTHIYIHLYKYTHMYMYVDIYTCMYTYVMKPHVRCAKFGIVRDNKSIKTIIIPRTSYQTRPNQETNHIHENIYEYHNLHISI